MCPLRGPCFHHVAIDILKNCQQVAMGLHSVIGKGARSMVFSKNQDEQRILSAIRESLFQQNPQMAQLGGRPHEEGALVEDDKSVDEVSYHAAAGIVPEPSIKPIERQATAQGGAITRDSPSIAPDAPAIASNSRQTTPQTVSSVRPSVAKQLFRTGAYGALITVFVSAALVWQSSDDTTKGIIKGWVNSLEWSSPPVSNLPPQSDSVIEAVSSSAGQPPHTGTTVIRAAASASEPSPTSTPTEFSPESSPDLKKQLETLTSDLAVVRQIVEQVAARQDQMARDIATLQADEQNLRQRISRPVSPSGRRRPRP